MRAAAIGLALLALAGCGANGDEPARTSEETLHGVESLEDRFDGISQDGAFLGSADAPFTLVEFADLQCPFCARFDRTVLRAVIDRFVRRGRLRIELRPVAFLGPDSGPAAGATLAAGLQDRMWQFADIFYRNQGAENSGYVTAQFLQRVARAAGLDVERWRRDSADASRLDELLDENVREARTAGVRATPTFRLGRTGGFLAPFLDRTARRSEFIRRLERRIGRG